MLHAVESGSGPRVPAPAITRAIGEIRRLLAERGCAVPDRPGLRLRTLTDVFAHAQAEGIELRLDATEIQVRRPPAGRGGRRAFVSGKKKQNTMKATVIADRRGRTLWTDALRPGRMHDATAARNEGIAVCFQHFADVEVLLDDGYPGLSRDHRGQAVTPPRKPRPGALPDRVEQWERDRHGHSFDRITVEHALADWPAAYRACGAIPAALATPLAALQRPRQTGTSLYRPPSPRVFPVRFCSPPTSPRNLLSRSLLPASTWLLSFLKSRGPGPTDRGNVSSLRRNRPGRPWPGRLRLVTVLEALDDSGNRVTRVAGNSVIRSHDNSGAVSLYSCAGLPVDGWAVPGRADTDRRWFLVTLGDKSPHPGRRGYVFSAEIPVKELSIPSDCGDLLSGQPQDGVGSVAVFVVDRTSVSAHAV
nr:transposase family protein [Streptomyces roseirectus]